MLQEWKFVQDRGILPAVSRKSSSEDLWGRAVVCAQRAQETSDPQKRAVFVYLAEFWLELSRHDTSQVSEATAADLAAIERMEADLLGLTLRFH
jgi:hypothetical protein